MATPEDRLAANAAAAENPQKRSKGKNDEIPQTSDQDAIWAFFNDPNNPRTDFFGSIKIDRQSGFDELPDMWSNGRYLFGAVALVTFFSNMFSVISFNLDLLSLRDSGRIDCLPDNIFLLTGWIAGYFFNYGTTSGAILIVATLELTLLMGLYAWGTWQLVSMFTTTIPWLRWHRVSNFFFNVYPMLSTLSMIRILNYVTPQVIVPDLLAAIKNTFSTKTGTCDLAWFFASRFFCLIAGFDAFLYKFQVLANKFEIIQDPSRRKSVIIDGVSELCPSEANFLFSEEQSIVVVQAITFVFQMLGVVQLGWFTKNRIFVFIFAGEDGQMSQKELAIKKTFDAMVAYRIFQIHGLPKALFFWWSFSDADFQKMVLDSKDDDSSEQYAASKGLVSQGLEGGARGMLNQ